VAKFLKKSPHLSGEDEQEVRRLTRNLINKLLHTPSTRLKQTGDGLGGLIYSDALQALFNLQPDPDEAENLASSTNPKDSSDSERQSTGKVVRLPVQKKQ
jgi:glutamyl-tRNA reductase